MAGLAAPFFLASVRGRIVFGFALLVIILAAVVAGAAWLAEEHRSALARAESGAATVSSLKDAQSSGTLAMVKLQGYLISGDETLAPGVRADLASSMEQLEEARAFETADGHPDQAERISGALAGLGALTEAAERVIELRRSGDVAGAAQVLQESFTAAALANTEFERLIETERSELSALRADTEYTGDRAFSLVLASGAIGAILGLAISIAVARSILRPLGALEEAALRVAAGDLDAHAQITGPRELARLSASFNRMTEALLDASKRRELEAEREAAHAALRESEVRHRTLLENLPQRVFLKDRDFAYVSCNANYARDLNISPDDIAGKTDHDFFPGELADKYRADDQRTMDSGETEEFEEEYVQDGRKAYVQTVKTPVRDENGDAVGVLGIFWDVTERRRAQEALRESEERFRSLIENVSDIIAVIEPDGTLRYESPSGQRLGGYEAGELIGTKVTDLIHPDDLPAVTQALAELSAGPGETRSAQYRFKMKDGDWRVFEAVGRAHVDGSGALRIIVNSRDVTERKAAEEALRDSEQRFRSLLESAPMAAIITNARGHIELVNAAAEELFGYESNELIGQPVEVLVPERFRERHARLVAEFLSNPARKRMAGGRDVLALRKDGGEFAATCGLAAIETPSGPLAISFVMDITARKAGEEALREAETKYRTLVEQVPAITYVDAIDDASPTGFTNVYFSPQCGGMLGYSAEEFMRHPELWQQALHPEDLDRALSLDAQHYATGQPISSEYRLIARDGRIVWVHDQAVMVRDAAGRQRYSQGVLLDITERKQAEEELARVNREMQREQREIEALNRSLERKVRERTRALRIANRELQTRNRDLLDARAQAVTDALTGLHNHRAFHERVRDEVSRAQVNGSELGLIMMDVDAFKSINDSLGHLAGDRILRGLARTLGRTVPQGNAYRYGGDEFAVLLPAASPRETIALAEELRRAVEKRTNGNEERVTISLGVACYPDTASSAEDLIYGSDAAMYWAKSAGKNRVGDWSELVRHRAEGVLPWYAADRAVRAPDTVAALAAALAAKDPATASHTERCSWYAARLAEELGLDERDTSIVRLSSLLHDIGKLAVPDEVLFKPGPLDEDEWALMRQHPVTALHILGQIRSIADATPAVLHHHEHFDGSGYPDGLSGDKIPIASRILLVTDAFDAMTTDRPYRRAMPVEAAKEELECNAGTQFDPEVVAAFLRILERHGAEPLAWKGSESAGRAFAGGRSNGNGRGTDPKAVPQPASSARGGG